MLTAGVPPNVVAAQLGHADPSITATIYSYLIEERDLDLGSGAFEVSDATGTLRETLREDSAAL